jgi:hypothetical protein
MRGWTLTRRSLAHYWRINLAVVLGVATGASVLAGALAIGDSVRHSLARAALARLGNASHALESTGLFREGLASELGARLWAPAAPLLFLHGGATHASSGRRAGDVRVYGVDERFWSFHGVAEPALTSRDALLGAALLGELGAAPGDGVLLRLDATPDVPGSNLFGRRDAPAHSLRVTVGGALPRGRLGEFALRPSRDAVRAAFVPLALLQRTLGVPGRVNTVLLSAADAAPVASSLRESVQLEDLGLRLRALPAAGALQLDSASSLLDARTVRLAVALAAAQDLRVTEALVYLANSIRHGPRELPYALVAALDDDTLQALTGRAPVSQGEPAVFLNEWAAADLRAAPGALLDLAYYRWLEEGRLETRHASFRLAGVLPIAGLAAGRELVPEFPGITDAPELADWDPPFPIDLSRIRPRDEEYWERHRTTPKAFVPLRAGQQLWAHRLGRVTALRFRPAADVPLETAREDLQAALRAALAERPPLSAGPIVLGLNEARASALAAARGSTDFGEYFVYFSFFLVAAALLLAGLFFRLGIEQRVREIGLLGALGFAAARLRRQFLGEGLLLAALGGALGAGAAPLYASLVLLGLRALWSDVLPTADLGLHVSPRSLATGALGAAAASVLAVLLTLRGVQALSARALLSGAREVWGASSRHRPLAPAGLALGAALIVWAAGSGRLAPTPGFFGAGGLLLVSAILASRLLVGGRPRRAAALSGVAALGRRSASYRPGRSVACVALLAFATFVIVAVGAFRREAVDTTSRSGEAGGYALLGWSLRPLHHGLASAAGREALGLSARDFEGVAVAAFRASRGEEASCLNLHRPQRPTLLAPGPEFLREGRFSFQASLAETPAERANPWLLLEREADDGAIPAIGDANSLAYVLHKELGEVIELGDTGVRLRLVAALRPGLFQGELLVGERHFLQAFPHEAGDRFFLIETRAPLAPRLAAQLESRLADFGFDVSATAARLASFHRVENTYISTFQALGALGLLLGTVGLATVLVRNALEQRRELALLRAVGYASRHLVKMLLAENALLLSLGLAAGALPALVAIAPALAPQRGALPLALIAGLSLTVAISGALVSWLGVVVIRRLPLLTSLREE